MSQEEKTNQFETEIELTQEELNAIKFCERQGERKAYMLLTRLMNQAHSNRNNLMIRKRYMDQTQVLYNAFIVVFDKCPFGVAKIKKKE